MENFNQNGWTCRQCVCDPCLFYSYLPLQRGVHEAPRSKQGLGVRVGVNPAQGGRYSEHKCPAAEAAWVLIHTDDCDAIDTSEAIVDDMRGPCGLLPILISGRSPESQIGGRSGS